MESVSAVTSSPSHPGSYSSSATAAATTNTATATTTRITALSSMVAVPAAAAAGDATVATRESSRSELMDPPQQSVHDLVSAPLSPHRSPPPHHHHHHEQQQQQRLISNLTVQLQKSRSSSSSVESNGGASPPIRQRIHDRLDAKRNDRDHLITTDHVDRRMATTAPESGMDRGAATANKAPRSNAGDLIMTTITTSFLNSLQYAAALVRYSDLAILHYNDSACELFGYRSEEATGQPLPFLFPQWNPRSAKWNLDHQHRHHLRESFRRTLLAQRKDGGSLWVELVLSDVEQDLSQSLIHATHSTTRDDGVERCLLVTIRELTQLELAARQSRYQTEFEGTSSQVECNLLVSLLLSRSQKSRLSGKVGSAMCTVRKTGSMVWVWL